MTSNIRCIDASKNYIFLNVHSNVINVLKDCYFIVSLVRLPKCPLPKCPLPKHGCTIDANIRESEYKGIYIYILDVLGLA